MNTRALSVALRVTALRTPTEELLDLLGDCQSYRDQNGLVIAELRDATVEKLWGMRGPSVRRKSRGP